MTSLEFSLTDEIALKAIEELTRCRMEAEHWSGGSSLGINLGAEPHHKRRHML